MPKVLTVYIVIEVAAILVAIISFIFWDKRYRKNHGVNIPPGFEKTNEVTIDPKSTKRLRVYFKPSTGERFYHEERD